ncbi:hypothetical protein ES707_12194 [subsurface metagenome]
MRISPSGDNITSPQGTVLPTVPSFMRLVGIKVATPQFSVWP